MKRVVCTRYVTPLKEGGSLPAIVEADDSGMYVTKFRGAGQGVKALIAETICGELARALGLPMPQAVIVQLPTEIARAEPDEEVQDLLKASVGDNYGIDYLPSAIVYDPAAGSQVSADLASRIVWFDALVTNIDRTAKNTNLLWWHRQLWLIDHGAALYVHHSWESPAADTPFPSIANHVLLPRASTIESADAALRPLVTSALLERVVAEVNEAWLPVEDRARYVDYLSKRVAHADAFVQEALRAQRI